MSGIDEVFGTGEAGETTADDGHLFLLGIVLDTESGLKGGGHGLCEAVVVCVFHVGFGVVLHDETGGSGSELGRTDACMRGKGVNGGCQDGQGCESQRGCLHCVIL